MTDADGSGPRSVVERRKRDRRLWRTAFLVSAAVHLLILLLWPGVYSDPEDVGDSAGPDGAATPAAAGLMRALAPASAPPDARRPPPTLSLQVDLPEPIEFDPEATREVDPDVPELPDPGHGTTTGAGETDSGDTGTSGASGAGTDGDGGGGLRSVAPVPQRAVQPRHRDLEDQRVAIRVFVDAEGRVVADSTRLEPPPSSEELARHLRSEAAGWLFRPARENGTAVAAWWSFEVGG